MQNIHTYEITEAITFFNTSKNNTSTDQVSREKLLSHTDTNPLNPFVIRKAVTHKREMYPSLIPA